MTQTTDVVVVGGGVIGCFVAYELSKAGHEVVVVEKSEVGAEASSAAAGLLVPLHVADKENRALFDFHLASARMFPRFVPELEQETGIKVEYAPSGILRVSLDEAEEAAFYAQFQSWQDESGMALTWLDKKEVFELEPNLAPTVCGGIFAREEGSVNSGRLVLALARAASAHGAAIRQGCLATGLRTVNGRFAAVQTSEGEIAADHLVIAAGAWSRALGEWLNFTLPIAPARGQMLSFKAIQRLLRHPISSSQATISPRADGAIYVGATIEMSGFDKRLKPEDTVTLVNQGAALIPALREAQIEKSWTGLRPYCEDGLPVIGRLPGWDNVVAATGHYKMGIIGSPITAKIIKELITEGRSEARFEPFSPARFAND